MFQIKSEIKTVDEFFQEIDKICSSKENLEAFLTALESRPLQPLHKIDQGTFLSTPPPNDGVPHYYHYPGREIFKGAYVPSQGDAIDIIAGDLHGTLKPLKKSLISSQFFENNKVRLFFVGDYVDRGPYSLKTLISVLYLQFLFPGRVFPLMGDHELGESYLTEEEEVKLNEEGSEEKSRALEAFHEERLNFLHPQMELPSSLIEELLTVGYDPGKLSQFQSYQREGKIKWKTLCKEFNEIKQFHDRILQRLLVCIRGDDYSGEKSTSHSFWVATHSSLGAPVISSSEALFKPIDVSKTDPLQYPIETCWVTTDDRGYGIILLSDFSKQAAQYNISTLMRGHDRQGLPITEAQNPLRIVGYENDITLRAMQWQGILQGPKETAITIHTIHTTSAFDRLEKTHKRIVYRIGKSSWKQIPLKELSLEYLQLLSLLEKVKIWTIFASQVKSLPSTPVIITFREPESIAKKDEFFIPIDLTKKNWLEKSWIGGLISSPARADFSEFQKTEEERAGLLVVPKSYTIIVKPLKKQDPAEIDTLLRAAASMAAAMLQNIKEESRRKTDITGVPLHYRPAMYTYLKSLHNIQSIVDGEVYHPSLPFFKMKAGKVGKKTSEQLKVPGEHLGARET